MKYYFVYILTNKSNKVLYTGVTNNIQRRYWEHKNGLHDGFTRQYKVNKLVYIEKYEDVREAIKMEKYIKGKTRKFRVGLIEKTNPDWVDFGCKLK